MQLPLSWLKEFINLEDLSPLQIADFLTSLGLEVEKSETYHPPFHSVVVAKVVEANPHPNAERLRIATVDDGHQLFQVVCGASNCRAGLVTALAYVGASVVDEKGEALKIKKSKIRGVESHGMLCSIAELGLGTDDLGIVELGAHLPLGSNLKEIYEDTIFHISLTCNLNHANSLIGVARELSAILDRPIRTPALKYQDSTQPLGFDISLHPNCPRYTCRLLENITVGPSPHWIVNRLQKSGVRSVNNVVDILNYVTLECGQPMHAFDADCLQGPIRIEMAEEKTLFASLDGKERLLRADNLLISDAKGPIAIAGVIGSAHTQVTSETKRVLIESAYFLSEAIRKSSKALGLSTDASKRFERSSDPGGLLHALNRAVMLLQEHATAKVASCLVDIHSQPFTAKTIVCRLERVNAILGTQLSLSEVEELFQRLYFQVSCQETTLHVRVPTFRTDLHAEIDLIEEVARLFGLSNLPRTPAYYQQHSRPHIPLFTFEQKVRETLLKLGLQEMLCCDLIGPKELSFFPIEWVDEPSLVRLKNANVEEHSILRASLLPGLLQVAKENLHHQCRRLAGFEIGHVYRKNGSGYQETIHIALLLMGKRFEEHWDQQNDDFDFYDLKGILEQFFIGINSLAYFQNFPESPVLHPGQQLHLWDGGSFLGSFGQIHPAICRKKDIPAPLFYAEFDLGELLQTQRGANAMEPLAQYPGSWRDLTLTLQERTPAQKVLDGVKKIKLPLLQEVTVQGIYRSEKLGVGLKNLTLRLLYRHPTRTLSFEEVQEAHAALTQALQALDEGGQG